MKITNTKGVTLIENMMAAAILVTVLTVMISTMIAIVKLNELSKNYDTATFAVQSKLDEIKATAFNNIVGSYDNATFTVNNLNGIGVSYVDNTNPELLLITTSFCWRQSSGRIIGEDLDLDGILDVGEDLDGNGIIDSPVQVSSYIYNI